MNFSFYDTSLEKKDIFDKFETKNIFTTQGLLVDHFDSRSMYVVKHSSLSKNKIEIKDIVVLNDDKFRATYGTNTHLDIVNAIAKGYALYQIDRINRKMITHDVAFEMLSGELIKEPSVYTTLYEVFKANKNAFEIYETICREIGCIVPHFSSLERDNLHNLDGSSIKMKEIRTNVNHILSSFHDVSKESSFVYQQEMLKSRLFRYSDLQFFAKSIMETFYHQGDSVKILTLASPSNGILNRSSDTVRFLDNLKNVLSICDSMIDIDIRPDEGFVKFSQGSDAIVFLNTPPNLDFSKTLEHSVDSDFVLYEDLSVNTIRELSVEDIVNVVWKSVEDQHIAFHKGFGPWGIPAFLKNNQIQISI